LRPKRLGSELSGGHLPDLLLAGDCGPNDHPLVDGRCIPAVHHAGVRLPWASTLLEAIAVLLAPMSFLLYKYVSRIRMRSSFAPCIDLKVAKFLKGRKGGGGGVWGARGAADGVELDLWGPLYDLLAVLAALLVRDARNS